MTNAKWVKYDGICTQRFIMNTEVYKMLVPLVRIQAYNAFQYLFCTQISVHVALFDG